eukprot:364898-Chlamydomonas_euryale.AAC.7
MDSLDYECHMLSLSSVIVPDFLSFTVVYMVSYALKKALRLSTMSLRACKVQSTKNGMASCAPPTIQPRAWPAGRQHAGLSKKVGDEPAQLENMTLNTALNQIWGPDLYIPAASA